MWNPVSIPTVYMCEFLCGIGVHLNSLAKTMKCYNIPAGRSLAFPELPNRNPLSLALRTALGGRKDRSLGFLFTPPPSFSASLCVT